MGAESSSNTGSSMIDIDEDALILSLIDDLSDEIDEEYTCDTSETSTETPKHQINDHELSDCIPSVHSIHDLYTIQTQIGKGVSASVFLAQSKQTYKQYALKQMSKSDANNRSSFVRELQTLKGLHHPNIIHLNDAYISDQHYHIATEYCSGGTLLQRLNKKKRFAEWESAQFVKQILTAIDHIHAKNIVHRDLKLSNIVFADRQNTAVKLIDFGESERIIDPCQIDRDTVGSLHFFAPETTFPRCKSDLFAGDMWAVGVITYMLIYGAYPFHAKDLRSMIRCIMTTPLKWHNHVQISDACKDFIQSLLNIHCKKRFTVKEALLHDWITCQNKLENQMHGVSDSTARKQRYAHTKMLSDHDINAMDISGILDEIDAEIACNAHKK